MTQLPRWPFVVKVRISKGEVIYLDLVCSIVSGDRFSEELLESENDRLINGVAGKVSSLKHVSSTLPH